MADAQIAAVKAQMAGYLLRCPAGLQPIHDVLAQVAVADQLAQPGAPGLGFGLGIQRVIAREMLELGVDKAVALQLTMDRGAVATETLGDLQNRHPRVMPACNLAPIFEAEVEIGVDALP